MLGFSSRRTGRFTVRTRPAIQRFDLGSGGVRLQRDVTVWELIDSVVTRRDSIAKCMVQACHCNGGGYALNIHHTADDIVAAYLPWVVGLHTLSRPTI